LLSYLIGLGSISAVNAKSILARGLLIIGGLTMNLQKVHGVSENSSQNKVSN
jgi:hypothetical protein